MIRVKDEKKYNQITCNFCNETLLYDEEDLIKINGNWNGFICPCCRNSILVEKRKSLIFPDTFYQFGVTENCVHLTNEKTQELINDVIGKTIKNGTQGLIATGDTLVLGELEDDEFLTIYVAKNYYTDYIDLNK